MKTKHAIDRAVAIAGSQAELARQLNVDKSSVTRWVSRERPVPARQAIRIERWSRGLIRAVEFDPEPQQFGDTAA